MRAFIIWIIAVLGTFALVAFGYHTYLTGSPRKVLVVVDSSFSMQNVWPTMPRVLREICAVPYAEYAIITEKNRVHSWSTRCDLGGITPYAPREFSKLKDPSQFPEIEQANSVFFITNAEAGQVSEFTHWNKVTP